MGRASNFRSGNVSTMLGAAIDDVAVVFGVVD